MSSGDYSTHYNKEAWKATAIIAAGLILLLGIIAFFVSIDYWNYKEYNVVKVLVVQDNNKTLYQLTTEDGDTIVCENDDLLFIGKTNSTDYAAQLRNLELQGNCNVIIGTYGFRIPLFSTYPNIAKIKLVEGNQETIINSEVVYV